MFIVTPQTREQIKQLIARKPGVPARRTSTGARDRVKSLVLCTSATPAAVSGVGAQCYPGIVIDPRSDTTTQDTLGVVWLTLVGDGVQARKPREGGVYDCYLAGEVEAATGDVRPRAFATMGEAAKPSTNCTSFLGSLKPGRCYLLTIPDAGDGSCSCVPTGQTAKLTYSTTRQAHTSSTLLYGCPPGVFTSLCPQPTGAPKKWNLPVSGLTGDFEHFNQNYTITHSTGETWTATKGGITVAAVQTTAGVWSLTLTDGETTITYVVEGVIGCCSAITFSLDDGGGADDAPEEVTLSPATNCGKGPAYKAVLDKCSTECMRNARLRWEPVAGSGAKTILFDPPSCGVDANGNKFAEFSTDDPLLCSGTEGEGCTDNKFTVRVTCGCDPAIVCGDVEVPAVICLRYSIGGASDFGELTIAVSATGQWTGEASYYIQPNYGGLEVITGVVSVGFTCVEGGALIADVTVTFYTSGCDSCERFELCTKHGSGPVTFEDGVPIFDVTLTAYPGGDPSCATKAWSSVRSLSCVPESGETYVCVNGSCIEVYDGSGTVLADCVALCGGTVTWDCVEGVCTQVSGSGGEFATQALCVANCGGTLTYDCVNGDCIAIEGPDGEFATLAGCQAECRCEIAEGAEVYLDVPDGPRAGLWTGTWELNYDGLGSNRVIFGNGEGDAPFPFNVFSTLGTGGSGPRWSRNGTGGSGIIPAEDVDCGPPLSIRIDGAVLGSTGDVIVST